MSPFGVVVDNQEKSGAWHFSGIIPDASYNAKNGEHVVVPLDRSRHLVFGDYAIQGYEENFRIERKSKEDMYSTVGLVLAHRKDFEKKLKSKPDLRYENHWFEVQLEGLNSLRGHGHLICEATFGDLIVNKPSHSGLHAKSVSRTLLKWFNVYPDIHFHFLDNARFAELFAYRLMESYHKNILRKNQ